MKARITIRSGKRKEQYEKAVTLNLTFNPVIRRELDRLVSAGGYKGPAEYFAAKVRREAGLDVEDKEQKAA